MVLHESSSDEGEVSEFSESEQPNPSIISSRKRARTRRPRIFSSECISCKSLEERNNNNNNYRNNNRVPSKVICELKTIVLQEGDKDIKLHPSFKDAYEIIKSNLLTS